MAIGWNETQVVATIAAAVAAFVAAAVAWVTFRQQFEPEVIVYATPDLSRPTNILLVIENVGRRAAWDVSFTSSRPLPSKAWGITPKAAESMPAEQMTTGPMITGIPFLGPGSRRQISWGQYGGLFRALGPEGITITCRFRSDAIAWSAPRDHVTTSVLEAYSFDATDAVDADGARQSAEQLKRIADFLEGRASKMSPEEFRVWLKAYQTGDSAGE
jgi:hypothetical protein